MKKETRVFRSLEGRKIKRAINRRQEGNAAKVPDVGDSMQLRVYRKYPFLLRARAQLRRIRERKSERKRERKAAEGKIVALKASIPIKALQLPRGRRVLTTFLPSNDDDDDDGTRSKMK